VDVGGQVLRQVVRPREALAAGLAVVRPFAGVDPQVAGEVRLAPKSPAAEEAHERPLAGVLAHVQLQVLLGAHALAAEGAREPRGGRPAREKLSQLVMVYLTKN